MFSKKKKIKKIKKKKKKKKKALSPVFPISSLITLQLGPVQVISRWQNGKALKVFTD